MRLRSSLLVAQGLLVVALALWLSLAASSPGLTTPVEPSRALNAVTGTATRTAPTSHAVYVPHLAREIPPLCQPTLDRIPSPNLGSGGDVLTSVAVVDRNDVWAFGNARDGGEHSPARPLALRWDGRAWSTITMPHVTTGDHHLLSTMVISPDNIWVVGSKTASPWGWSNGTLTYHWNGAEWRHIPTPTLGHFAQLNSISASPDGSEIWAVGWYNSAGPPYYPLTLRWDGAAWTPIDAPNLGETGIRLLGVAVSSPDNIWAVGSYGARPTDPRVSTPTTDSVVMRWDGVAWHVVPLPSVGRPTDDDELAAIALVSPTEAWAVGSVGASSLVMRWDGASWSRVNAPDTGILHAVVAAPGEAWTIGRQTLHWNGRGWKEVPVLEDRNSFISDIGGDSRRGLWIVGRSQSGTIARRFDGTTWLATDTPSISAADNHLAGASAAGGVAWAVGYRGTPGLTQLPLILRWEQGQWTEAPNPAAGVSGSLAAVSALWSNDVWAVGKLTDTSGQPQVPILHWDGQRWTNIPWHTPIAPSLPSQVTLLGVAAVAIDDVWAVGAVQTDAGVVPTRETTLALRWNGVQWSQVETPQFSQFSRLTAIAARRPDDIWAVGYFWDIGRYAYEPLALHWDGAAWRQVPIPAGGSSHRRLHAVAVTPSDGLWAVGEDSGAILVLRWDGAAWQPEPTPPFGPDARLEGVTSIADRVIATGSHSDGRGGRRAFVLEWNGRRWRTWRDSGATSTQLSTVVVPDAATILAVGSSRADWLARTLAVEYTPPECASLPPLPGGVTPTPSPTRLPPPVPTPVTGWSFSTYPAQGMPWNIAPGPDRAVWFTAATGAYIGRISPYGTVSQYPLPDNYGNPRGITTGPDGALWFTDSQRRKIGRLDLDGALSLFPVADTHEYTRLDGITTGPDGALWFAGIIGAIGRITTDGSITTYPLPPTAGYASQITLGPDGALWFTLPGANAVGRMTQSGDFRSFPLPAPYSEPSDITVGPDGALWFTESGRNVLGRLTTGGVLTEYLISPSDYRPKGITTGPDAALWFTTNGDRIGRLDLTGRVTWYSINRHYAHLEGITTGSDGALWFAMSGLNAVGRLGGLP